MWFPRIIHLIAVGICALRASSQDNDWNRQFMEMKTMMSNLESKISDIHNQLKPLDFLDYVLKVRSTDNDIASLKGRVDQMATKVDSIEESIRTLSSKQCPQERQQQSSDESTSGTTGVQEGNILQKLDDYGRKILQSQRDLQNSDEEHRESLSSLLEVVRSGFTKVMTKIESLLTIEGQMTIAVSLIRRVAAISGSVREEISKLFAEVVALTRNLTNVSDTSASLMHFANEVRHSISFPVNQLDQAIEMGHGVRLQMSRLNELERKVAQASSLSKRVYLMQELNHPSALPENPAELPDGLRTATLNLTHLLTEIENMTLPLFMSLPYNFQKIQTLVLDAFASIADRHQCRSDHTTAAEMQDLREFFSEQNSCPGQRPPSEAATDSIKNLVNPNLTELKAKIAEIKSDLASFVHLCQEHRFSPGAHPISLQQRRTHDGRSRNRTAGTTNHLRDPARDLQRSRSGKSDMHN